MTYSEAFLFQVNLSKDIPPSLVGIPILLCHQKTFAGASVVILGKRISTTLPVCNEKDD